MSYLLKVKNLEVKFALRTGTLTALHKINFSLQPGERLGLVGESGAGKSVAGCAILNLISKPGFISGGEIIFQGQDISKYSPQKMRQIRGNEISMIFQDPMMTLNPVLTIGTQMIETILAHKKISFKQAKEISIECLKKVAIPSPEKRLDQYPFEFSGGMRQRIVIAISLLTNPSLIIADEPTTALDVTIQAEIMDILLNLCLEKNMGLILITHDLGVVSQTTQKIIVMYAGRIVEKGPTQAIIEDPKHPYTQGLLKALPQLHKKGEPLYQIPGIMPSLSQIPSGCPFHPRCAQKIDICSQEEPSLHTYSSDREVACHLFSQ